MSAFVWYSALCVLIHNIFGYFFLLKSEHLLVLLLMHVQGGGVVVSVSVGPHNNPRPAVLGLASWQVSPPSVENVLLILKVRIVLSVWFWATQWLLVSGSG